MCLLNEKFKENTTLKSQIIGTKITDMEFILFCTRSSVRKIQLFWIVYKYCCTSVIIIVLRPQS